MKHFTIIELDKNFSIPESLSECTQEQYIDANRFIYAYQNGLIDENQFKSLMIISFLGINPSALREEMLDKAFRNIAFLSQYIMNFFEERDRKSTRLNSSHVAISYAVFCLKKKITQ